MRRANQIAGIVGLAVAAYIIVVASKMTYTVEYSPGAGFFPLWLGIFLAVLSAALFIQAVSPRQKGVGQEESFLPEKAGRKRTFLFFVVFALCIALMGRLGFLITSFLFALAFLVVVEKYSWLKGLITSLCMAAVLYLLFNTVLQVPLPKGLWGI
jgi:putative tricarboxylic transport membrane protein